MTRARLTRLVPLLILFSAAAYAADGSVQIPRVSQPPRLEDFEEMVPRGASAELAKLDGFVQLQPSDGRPATQKTEVYLGYDRTNLYVI